MHLRPELRQTDATAHATLEGRPRLRERDMLRKNLIEEGLLAAPAK